MYIVTRTFRDANGVFEVGSIVDPTSVRTFRSRLQQRHIVDIDERNIEEWAKFFKNRYGIDLSDKLTAYLTTQSDSKTLEEEQSGINEDLDTSAKVQLSTDEDDLSW